MSDDVSFESTLGDDHFDDDLPAVSCSSGDRDYFSDTAMKCCTGELTWSTTAGVEYESHQLLSASGGAGSAYARQTDQVESEINLMEMVSPCNKTTFVVSDKADFKQTGVG